MPADRGEEWGALPDFASWLAYQGEGAVNRRLTEAIQEAAQAAVELDKAATVTLKVTVDRAKDGMVIVTPTVTAKIPQPGEPAGWYWLDPKGRLATDDPYRQRLFNVRTLDLTTSSSETDDD